MDSEEIISKAMTKIGWADVQLRAAYNSPEKNITGYIKTASLYLEQAINHLSELKKPNPPSS